MSTRWVSVCTFEGREFDAEFELSRAGFRVFAPWQMDDEEVFRNGRMRRRSKKVARFPGYIFVELLEGHSLYRLQRTGGVISVARRQDGAVLPIADKVMDLLREACTRDGYWPPEAPDVAAERAALCGYRIGEVVVLKDGPFAGFPGIVERIDAGRQIMVVSVTIFGRSTSVECPLSWASDTDTAMAG
ncbi:transcription termination/antitermination NusG family protein [Xanthobacter sp.]|uniref:transcription termination/antitermination protein NusG n=1 Tax=Xanthobacter sp. TaxID=35809 RepID=UPI0025E4B285|nr:transcription termination/antitermination NusG family protein [Xanthobacter sp.]